MSKTKSSPSAVGSNESAKGNDIQLCVIKLCAESDQRQKLIGILSFPVDWQKEPFDGLNMHAIPFKKCVDNTAVVVLSTKIISI